LIEICKEKFLPISPQKLSPFFSVKIRFKKMIREKRKSARKKKYFTVERKKLAKKFFLPKFFYTLPP